MATTASLLRAFAPLCLFLSIFAGAGIMLGDFYAIPGSVAMIPAMVIAVVMAPSGVEAAVDNLVAGACDPNIMVMVYIYLACGIFNQLMEDIGGGKAVVDAALRCTPPWFMLPGVFVASTMVGVALGTSMGTIASLTPIVRRIAVATNVPAAPLIGAVVSGATCGDNLSVISDTAIAACSTQRADRFEKMRLNAQVAAPGFLLTMLTLWYMPSLHIGGEDSLMEIRFLPLVPYVLTLVTALLGMNVLGVLVLGSLMAGTIGYTIQGPGYLSHVAALASEGMKGELDIILLALFTGGLSRIANEDGALGRLFSTDRSDGRDSTPIRGELILALLTVIADVLCANNTVAIVIVGPIAYKVASSHGVGTARAANILDVSSCVTQSLIPYGAQLLVAGKPSTVGAAISPWELMLHTHYPIYLGISMSIWMFLGRSTTAQPVKEE